MTRRFLLETELPGEGSDGRLDKRQYPDEVKHLSRVLRLGAGDRIELLNGAGKIAEAELIQVSPKEVIFKVKKVHVLTRRGPQIELGLGVLKAQRMDWLLEKISELGLAVFTPLLCERVVPADSKISKRQDRWNRICRAAIKQSGNPFLPTLNEPVALNEWAKDSTNNEAAFVLGFEDNAPLLIHSLLRLADTKSKQSASQKIRLAVGPEGGFSASEMVLLQSAGFKAVGLGDNVLRGETAGMVSVALALQALSSEG